MKFLLGLVGSVFFGSLTLAANEEKCISDLHDQHGKQQAAISAGEIIEGDVVHFDGLTYRLEVKDQAKINEFKARIDHLSASDFQEPYSDQGHALTRGKLIPSQTMVYFFNSGDVTPASLGVYLGSVTRGLDRQIQILSWNYLEEKLFRVQVPARRVLLLGDEFIARESHSNPRNGDEVLQLHKQKLISFESFRRPWGLPQQVAGVIAMAISPISELEYVLTRVRPDMDWKLSSTKDLITASTSQAPKYAPEQLISAFQDVYLYSEIAGERQIIKAKVIEVEANRQIKVYSRSKGGKFEWFNAEQVAPYEEFVLQQFRKKQFTLSPYPSEHGLPVPGELILIDQSFGEKPFTQAISKGTASLLGAELVRDRIHYYFLKNGLQEKPHLAEGFIRDPLFVFINGMKIYEVGADQKIQAKHLELTESGESNIQGRVFNDFAFVYDQNLKKLQRVKAVSHFEERISHYLYPGKLVVGSLPEGLKWVTIAGLNENGQVLVRAKEQTDLITLKTEEILTQEQALAFKVKQEFSQSRFQIPKIKISTNSLLGVAAPFEPGELVYAKTLGASFSDLKPAIYRQFIANSGDAFHEVWRGTGETLAEPETLAERNILTQGTPLVLVGKEGAREQLIPARFFIKADGTYEVYEIATQKIVDKVNLLSFFKLDERVLKLDSDLGNKVLFLADVLSEHPEQILSQNDYLFPGKKLPLRIDGVSEPIPLIIKKIAADGSLWVGSLDGGFTLMKARLP